MKNVKKSSVNSLLRKARSERGWSQQKLAEMVSTTSVNISRWENGSNFPTPYFIQKLCDAFEKTPAELGLISRSHIAKLWTVPFIRNPFFTGRESLLALLHERLSITRMAALTQAQALYGLGGIGKTQTAAEYAFRYGDEYTHVLWMTAATHETLDADFAHLAQLLSLREKDELDQSQIVAAVKRWLTANGGWLLIMDNADDLKIASEFLPTRHKGYVLFTTRDHASGMVATSIEVEKLSLQDGTLLLLRWSKCLDAGMPVDQALPENRAAAERIVKEMDGLPLALVQAGAYVAETGCSLEDYVELYESHHKELLARHSRLMHDYPETVATTWSLSFQQIEQKSSIAADLLRLCAFLAPDAIPEELLLQYFAQFGDAPEAEAGSDQFKLNEALGVLLKFSLVRREEGTHMLSIHRLVQTVLSDSMDNETRHAWAERTIQTINAIFPETDFGTSEKQQYFLQYYLPHVQVCSALISQYHLHSEGSSRLIFQAGVFLYVHGFYQQSLDLHQQALAIRKQIFGLEHPSLADSFTALAQLANDQRDFAQGEEFYQQALLIREKALGLDDPDTIRSLNNLSISYRNQGKYELAEQLLQQAISNSERTLGTEHLDTLYYVINLAKLYSEQRKYELAEPLLQRTLTISARILEPAHPLIAYNLNLLARLSFEQKNYKKAEQLWNQSLAILEKALGSHHPACAEILNDLAELYSAQGFSRKAQIYCQRALSIAEKILGPEHPETITYREHLSKIVGQTTEEPG